ncbi:multi-sensor signal transduction histidine kinase [Arcobacter nitrofigilis DSM 7299]|uniref:histidine kinase n=1 Tax=Arcobacter nitrofigilis (strain ATCC 33309 / DSM 7299 / CCUG 15893 / LMG 7604 / NCTC 12251 / CI) TaxID=572480 RepID=D5V7Y4_ARCNC|nr:ATP-binding protein [Arcobacter nitrofigilis]ADG94754.1 multi-sensor signal transduction histidine kinase [Arcobacter nitrofigilis DSM 7299]
MIKNSSLKTELLISILLVIILGIGTIFYFSYNYLKKEIDISQEKIYNEKIDNIIYLINQKYQTLLKTQMEKSYEESFKKGTLSIIKNVFNKNTKGIFPFIINEKGFLLLHRIYNEQDNNNLYKDKEEYKRIMKEKNGNFEIVIKEDGKWIIFKHFEPWNWIIGYRVDKKIKYQELYTFRDMFLGISLIIILAISLIVIVIVRKVLKPIDMLSNVSKKIASGDFNAEINVSGVKELKILSTNFESMRDKIVEDIHQLQEQEEKIKTFNSKLQEDVRLRTKELEEEKKVFETLFNDSSDGISLLKDEKFIDCNPALLKLFEINDKEEFLNLDPDKISPEIQPNGVSSNTLGKEYINKCLEKDSIRFEWLLKKRSGKEFWCEIVLTKIAINEEVVIHGLWRDIQDKKMLEIELENKNLDLQESNDELEASMENLIITQNKLVESEKLAGLGSLVSGVANEISAPIGLGITGASHLEYICEEISSKYESNSISPEEWKVYLQSSNELVKVIVSNLDKTEKIIKNFKQVAVDHTGEVKRVFKVAEYIRGVLISIDSLIKNKNIEFKLKCDDGLEVNSYPGFFAQILTHLISNSLEHAYGEMDKGIITFIARIEGNSFIFEYSDDGKGILEENLSKIYEPFFTTNRKNGSIGLGLNIIYNLVTINLRGKIDCISEKNNGTTFRIRIPL